MIGIARNAGPRQSCSWVPWAFVGAFGVVLAVNLTMIWLATQTFSGVVVAHPYERGLAYDQVIAGRQAGDAWRFDAALGPAKGSLTFSLAASGAAAPRADQITARLFRPLGDLPEIALRVGPAGPGRFVAETGSLPAGQWTLSVQAEIDGRSLTFDKRLIQP